MFPGTRPVGLYPWPDSNRHPVRDNILSVARLPVSPHGYFLCCAAPIRTGKYGTKIRCVAVTPRRKLLFYLSFKVLDFLFHHLDRLIKTFGCTPS